MSLSNVRVSECRREMNGRRWEEGGVMEIREGELDESEASSVRTSFVDGEGNVFE